MPGPGTKITDREKAAILMKAAGLVDNWTDVYVIADDKPADDVRKQSSLAASVSRWRNSAKVQKCLSDYEKLLADRDAEQRRIAREEEREKAVAGGSVSTKSNQAGKIASLVDYSDPVNQARKLNELVNSADDPGEALDALKVIISTQKADREAARDNKTVRAYIPITCSDCPLYSRAKNKLSK